MFDILPILESYDLANDFFRSISNSRHPLRDTSYILSISLKSLPFPVKPLWAVYDSFPSLSFV
jgi:hypothetical protein